MGTDVNPEANAPTDGTTEAATTEAISPVKAGLLEGLESVAEFFDAFDVPDECSLTDETGTTHAFPPFVSARRMIRSTRLVRVMLNEQPEGTEDEVLAVQEQRGAGAAVADLLARLVDKEENEARIHKLFELLHGPRYDRDLRKTVPGLLASAQKAAAAAGLTDIDGEIATNALDLFSTTEVIEGLLPFLPHIASKLAGTMRGLASQAR